MQNPTRRTGTQPSTIILVAFEAPVATVTPDDQPLASYEATYACGCGLANGRCEVHAAMMRVIRSAYEDPSRFSKVGRLADGFGRPGDNYGDWSAWRDSTNAAVERMYHAALGR